MVKLFGSNAFLFAFYLHSSCKHRCKVHDNTPHTGVCNRNLKGESINWLFFFITNYVVWPWCLWWSTLGHWKYRIFVKEQNGPIFIPSHSAQTLSHHTLTYWRNMTRWERREERGTLKTLMYCTVCLRHSMNIEQNRCTRSNILFNVYIKVKKNSINLHWLWQIKKTFL